MRRKRNETIAADYRANPGGFHEAPPVEALAEAVKSIGGTRWAIGTTFDCSAEFVNRWAEACGLTQDVLILTQNLERQDVSGPLAARVIEGCSIHAKVLLVRGPEGVACQIGSGNFTDAGLGGRHRDIVWTITANRENGDRKLLRDVCVWFRRRLTGVPYRLPDRKVWEQRLVELEQLLGPGAAGAALLTNDESPILDAFRRSAGGEIRSALVFSPYVDASVLAGCPSCRVQLVLPAGDMRRISGASDLVVHDNIELLKLKERFENGVFTHAKFYLIAGKAGTRFLAFGSANCTEAGLGRSARDGEGTLRTRSEVLVRIRVTPGQYKQLRRRLLASAEPIDPESLQDTASPELPDAEAPPMLVFANSQGEIEILLRRGLPVPVVPAVVRRGRVRLSATVAHAEEEYRCRPRAPEWVAASKLAESGWRLQWGGHETDIVFVADAIPLESDLSDLWGGDATALHGSGAGTPRVRGGQRGHAPPETRSTEIALDEYERRSARLCERLKSELKSQLPENLERFQRLWDEASSLGIDHPAAKSARVFLGLRMLAVMAANQPVPPPLAQFERRLSAQVHNLITDELGARASTTLYKRVQRWGEPQAWGYSEGR